MNNYRNLGMGYQPIENTQIDHNHKFLAAAGNIAGQGDKLPIPPKGRSGECPDIQITVDADKEKVELKRYIRTLVKKNRTLDKLLDNKLNEAKRGAILISQYDHVMKLLHEYALVHEGWKAAHQYDLPSKPRSDKGMI